jgi:hypothetical protein
MGDAPRGDQRAQWVKGETRTAMIILVSGRFRIELPSRSVLLAEQGDYVVFNGVDHSWRAEEDSVILGVRWPSVPGYAVPDWAVADWAVADCAVAGEPGSAAMLAGPPAPPLVTTDGMGDRSEPVAVDGSRRPGRETQDALPPGRVNGESGSALPLLATPDIGAWSPDAEDPVSRLFFAGHVPPPGGWLCHWQRKDDWPAACHHLTTA